MRFDQLFPEGEGERSRSAFPPMLHFPDSPSALCVICAAETQWVELAFECALCSEECLIQLEKEYAEANSKVETTKTSSY